MHKRTPLKSRAWNENFTPLLFPSEYYLKNSAAFRFTIFKEFPKSCLLADRLHLASLFEFVLVVLFVLRSWSLSYRFFFYFLLSTQFILVTSVGGVVFFVVCVPFKLIMKSQHNKIIFRSCLE